MNSRQKEMLQISLNSEKEILKKLTENYQDALDEITTRIAILQMREDADLQHVIYQVEYQKQLKTQIETILEQMKNNNFESVSEYLTQCYEQGFIGTLYDLQGQGIPLVFPIDQEMVVAAVQHETMLSESLYATLGKDTKELSKKIASEISRGITNNAMYSEIARNLSGYAGISKNNAMRIARTEGHRIQNKAISNAQENAKDRGADIVKIWDAALDGKTRDTHRKLDGQIRELDEPFEVDGMTAQEPGGFGIAEEDINCRCRRISKARWLLGEKETKYIGNTEKMTDEQLEPIANKLGISVETLRQHSDEIIPVKAKDYDDFKRQYDQIYNYRNTEEYKAAQERIAGIEKDNGEDRVRSNVQKMNDDVLGKSDTKLYNQYALNDSTDKWAREAKAELLSQESNIASRSKEVAIVYDNDGTILFRKYGSESDVQFSILDLLKIMGKVVTHNHPSGGSFSVGDINLLRIGKMSELRVATENGSYYLRYPEKWNKAINSKKKIQKERDNIISEIKGKYQQMYLNGEITKVQRFQMCSDEANRLFAERFGLEYGKETN